MNTLPPCIQSTNWSCFNKARRGIESEWSCNVSGEKAFLPFGAETAGPHEAWCRPTFSLPGIIQKERPANSVEGLSRCAIVCIHGTPYCWTLFAAHAHNEISPIYLRRRTRIFFLGGLTPAYARSMCIPHNKNRCSWQTINTSCHIKKKIISFTHYSRTTRSSFYKIWLSKEETTSLVFETSTSL